MTQSVTTPSHLSNLFRPLSGSQGHSPGPGPATQAGSGQVREEESLPANAKMVARNFRYMRRKPTIMAYKPPKGEIKFANS